MNSLQLGKIRKSKKNVADEELTRFSQVAFAILKTLANVFLIFRTPPS